MTITTPFLALLIHAPSSPTSFWRWRAAPKQPCPSCTSTATFEKTHVRISQTVGSSKPKPSNAGASTRKRSRHALTGAFKSP